MKKTKMGRPASQNPKHNIVGCKLTDVELEKLEKYCEHNQLSKSEVLRNGIRNIILIDKEN